MAKKKKTITNEQAFQAFLDDQEKRKQEAAQGQVRFREASQASRVQYTNPQYKGKSAEKSYKWETDLLKPLSIKGYGRSYNDKYRNWSKSQGMSDTDAEEYRRFMDFQEDRKKKDNQATGAHLKSEVMDGIFKSLEQRTKASITSNQKRQVEEAKKQQEQELKKQKEVQKKQALSNSIGKNNNLLDDLKAVGKTLGHAVNPFDDVSFTDAVTSFWDRNPSDTFKEIARGSNRAVDSASLGVMGNLDKKMTGQTPYYLSERKIGEGGGADMLTTGLGYLVPGVGAYKALNASKVGLGLTEFGTKGIGQRLASEAAKGAITGAGMTIPEVGVKEALNPQDQNWKDNLKYIGMNTALGAVADPALYGAGKAIGKGVNVGLKTWIKGDLPSFDKGAFNQTIENLAPSQPKTLPKQQPLTLDNTFNVKRTHNPNQPLNEFLGRPTQPESPIMQMAKKSMYQERALPDYSTARPVIEEPNNYNVYGVEVPKGDLIDTAPPEYWQKRYDDFTKFVKDSGYDEKNLSYESINELWSHFAKPDEPSLNAVIDLAYKGYKEPKVLDAAEVWDKMGNRPSVSQNAKNILLGNKKQASSRLLPEVKRPTVRQPEAPQLEPKTQELPKLRELLPTQETPIQQPKQVPRNESKPNERSFYNTVQNPEKLSPELEQRLADFDKTYKPMSNQELVDFANNYVTKDIEKAYQFVKNARKFDPRHVTVGHRLIDELQKAGQFDRALDVVERLAEQGTKAGQSIQSYSIYNRLTAEGQLLRAQRHVNKINENISDPAKKVKLTEQNIQDITHTADSLQKFAGQMDQANNVMKIMENVKKGNQATDAELDVVRSFVSDAKKFFGDLAPNVKEPKVKPVNDVRTRDKVVDFMSKKEEIAKKELQKIFGRANSLPVDAFYHLSVVGASKIAKGTVKLTDFTEEMVKEFGDVVRPYAKQIYNKAAETFNLQSEKMTAKRLSEVEKITNKALKDKNLDANQADAIREFARQVGAMSGDAKLDSSMELQSILQALERPTFGRKLSSAQTIAQLLNPKTIVRNAIGNEMFYRVEQINKLLATPVDIVRSKITGGERTITFVSHNQGKYWENFLKGAKAGWKGVNPMGLSTAYDLAAPAFKAKWNPLTYLEKALGATLRSFDYAGYMRAYNKTLGELGTLRAMNEGLKGQALKEAAQRYAREADESMLQIADQYAKYATFQDNTVLSTALTKVKKGMNKASTLGATDEFGLGDLVLKYPKTPGNLVMRALEYSPAGVVRSVNLLKGGWKNKDSFQKREFWLSFTRAITGTAGFSLLGYALADKGILTSSGNSDYEVASLERNAGKQPNSVNISALGRFIASGFNLDEASTKEDDTFVSYDWAQPISIAVALGTGVSQSQKESGGLNAVDAIKGAADSGFNTIIQSSVLKGVNDFLANYPGRTMSDRIGDATKGIAGSFIPTLFNQVRQASDNTARTTYAPSLLPEIKNRAVNRIPGLQKTLPPAYDTLGQKRESFQNDGNNLFNVFLNPSFVSRYKPSPEAELVLDLINRTGDKTVAPRIAQKKLDGKPLTTEQYAEIQRIMGEEVRSGLMNLSASDDETLAKEIEKVLRDAGKKAREAIRSQRGE